MDYLFFIVVILLYVVEEAGAVINGNNNDKKNVLFIISDDMRPDLGIYNEGSHPASNVHPFMHTPHIDALARESLLLTRAYVQYPLCGPSRASLLTGRRPDTIQIYNLHNKFRDFGNFVSLPQLFKQNGYATIGLGKIFHNETDPESWTEPYFEPEHLYRHIVHDSWAAISDSQLQERPLEDQQTTDAAITRLQQVAGSARSGKQPFFMAVGFHRPHLGLVCPKKFWQYYPETDIHLANFRSVPKDMPEIAWNRQCTLFGYHDTEPQLGFNASIKNSKALEVRRAYYSCISFVDSLVGELMAELETQGLSDNTIVVFVGDHGWQLGEHNQWCKQTNFEEALHTPAMVRIPGLTDEGIVTNHLTEFVDIYPTVVEAAGLEPLPVCPDVSTKTGACREGESLLPLVENPSRDDWKQIVFSQTMRFQEKYRIPYDIMGLSMRNHNYRFTEWVKFDVDRNQADWSKVEGIELYDLGADPEVTVNLAYKNDYQHIVNTLRHHLRAGWRDTGINKVKKNEFDDLNFGEISSLVNKYKAN